MEKLLNDAVISLVNQGKLSIVKINQLMALKEFIDRLAQKSYISSDVVEDLVSKYGSKPQIVTWGDYFQTEVAYDSYSYSDEEFLKVISTIKFDLMSSYEIFSNQSYEFFDWIEKTFKEIIDQNKSVYTEEEQEVLHLKILKDYYINMDLKDNFIPEEILWYNSFMDSSSEAIAQ
ncbi:MAG: hypothetical protein JW982_05705 [Spirochaetes bacterium]|nr:hypothetical protein [Spirochaetota bacterium]